MPTKIQISPRYREILAALLVCRSCQLVLLKTAALKRGLAKTSWISGYLQVKKWKKEVLVSFVLLHGKEFKNYEKDERMVATRKKKSGQMNSLILTCCTKKKFRKIFGLLQGPPPPPVTWKRNLKDWKRGKICLCMLSSNTEKKFKI